MTPYELDLLLGYYTSPDPNVRQCSILQETLNQFEADGILESYSLTETEFPGEPDGEYHGGVAKVGWRVTSKGRAYIEKILSIPYPEQEWRFPDFL
jgi:hypothetical protein